MNSITFLFEAETGGLAGELTKVMPLMVLAASTWNRWKKVV